MQYLMNEPALEGVLGERKLMCKSPWQQPERTGFTILQSFHQDSSPASEAFLLQLIQCAQHFYLYRCDSQLPHTRLLFHLPFKKQQQEKTLSK